MVGQNLSGKLTEVGQEVMLGTRDVAAGLARSTEGAGSVALAI